MWIGMWIDMCHELIHYFLVSLLRTTLRKFHCKVERNFLKIIWLNIWVNNSRDFFIDSFLLLLLYFYYYYYFFIIYFFTILLFNNLWCFFLFIVLRWTFVLLWNPNISANWDSAINRSTCFHFMFFVFLGIHILSYKLFYRNYLITLKSFYYWMLYSWHVYRETLCKYRVRGLSNSKEFIGGVRRSSVIFSLNFQKPCNLKLFIDHYFYI